ncbi:XrtA/PEP-CTERM system TPR-repeat protein PrsT [Thalassotalea sp. PLHSN55]|uniref:XrtA/PEP-CTERM system TPR-repeat protein PrsT n=1 Tax=Thalassotalea sp. PLHSN55 TaxID=3435888 RepID=UPI003F82E271
MAYKNKVAISLLALTIGLYGCSDTKSPEEYISSAKASITAGDANAAIINLKNLLRADASHGEGRFLLGQAYNSLGMWLAAEKELERALQHNFSADSVLPELAKVYYNLADTDGILTLLPAANELTPEAMLKVNAFLAMSYVKSSDYEEGKVALYEVIQSPIDSRLKVLCQAWLHGLNKEFDQALAVTAELIESEPGFAEAIEYQAYLYYRMQEMEKASELFAQYVKIHPKANEVRIMYALSLAYATKFAEAEKQADKLLTISPNSSVLNQIKAQGRFADGDFTVAKQHAEVALRADSSLLLARIAAGMSAYQLDQPEVAYSHLEQIKDYLTYQHPAKRVLSQLKLQLGYESEAYDELASASSDELDAQILAASAQEMFRLGKATEADFLLAKARDMEPENADINYQQGLYKYFDQDGSSISLFEQAYDKNPELDAALTLIVKKHLFDKDFTKAFEAANKVKTSNPELHHILNGLIFDKQDKLSEAKAEFVKVTKINSNNVNAIYMLGALNEKEGNFDQAIEYYQQVISTSMEATYAVAALLNFSNEAQYQERIEGFLKAEFDKNNANSVSALALSGYYALTNDLTTAMEVVESSLAKDDKNIQLLMFKGKIQANTKDYQGAIASFDKAIKENRFNPKPQIAKANVLKLEGKYREAIVEMEKAIDLMPTSTGLAVNLAKIHLDNNDIYAAKRVLTNLKNLDKEHIGMTHLDGQIAYLEKRYALAEQLLGQVYQQRQVETVLLEYVAALQKTNKSALALQQINAFTKGAEPSLNLLLKQAELLESTEPKKAMSIYQHVASKTNNHFAMLNNIAMLSLKLGKPTQALDNAKAAFEQAPDNVAIMNTYGLTLLANKQYQQSLTFLTQAKEAQPSNHNYLVHYLQALMANNNHAEVKSLLGDVDSSQLSLDAKQRFEQIKRTL